MFETGEELESEPDSVEKSAYRDERWMDFAYVLVPMLIFVGLGFKYQWGSYFAVVYGYSGYLYVHVITRPQYSTRRDDVRRAMWKFLPIHLCFLLVIVLGQYGWFRCKPLMPEWLIEKAFRGGSFYLMLGWIAAGAVGLGEYFALQKRLESTIEASEPPAG